MNKKKTLVIILTGILIISLIATYKIGTIGTGHAVNDNSKAKVSFSVESQDQEDDTGDDSGGGGGGTGGAAGDQEEDEKPEIPKTTSNITTKTELINETIHPGETKSIELNVQNTGEEATNVVARTENIENHITLRQTNFRLRPEQSGEINIFIYSKNNTEPSIKTGRVIIEGKDNQEIVKTIVKIKPKEPLLDLKTKNLNKSVKTGEKIQSNISATNIGDIIETQTVVEYSIKDFENKTWNSGREQITFTEGFNKKASLKIPQNAPSGEYIFYAKVPYQDTRAVASDTFNVEKSPLEKIKNRPLMIALSILLAIILAIAIYLIAKREKKREEGEEFDVEQELKKAWDKVS